MAKCKKNREEMEEMMKGKSGGKCPMMSEADKKKKPSIKIDIMLAKSMPGVSMPKKSTKKVDKGKKKY